MKEIQRIKVHERVVPFSNVQVYPARFPANAQVSFHLATLNDTLEYLLGLRKSTGRPYELLIEIKVPEYYTSLNRSISTILLKTLEAYNLTEITDPVTIQTFHIEELIHIRSNLSSRLRLVALLSWNYMNESSSDYDFYRSEKGLQKLSTFVQAIAPNMELLVNIDDDGSILSMTNLTSLAHQYRLAVYPWTFRKDVYQGDFEYLIDYFYRTVEIDGFITSQPDIVRKIVERSTSTSTAASPSFIMIFPWCIGMFVISMHH